MGEVLVRRRGTSVGVFRRIIVKVDGTVWERLRQDESKTLRLENGRHRVSAQMDWVSSGELEIDVSDDHSVVLETAISWRFLRWYFTRKPGGLDLEVVSR
jgi:hypothetical protein